MSRSGARRLALAVGLVLASTASACGTVTPDSLALVEETERRGETVIRLATYTNDGISAAIEQWEREHPTASVVIDRRSFDDHHASMLEPRDDDATPDIVAFDVIYSPNFRQRTDLFADLRQFGAGDFEPSSLGWRWEQGVADDGALVGLPIDVGGMALAYRIDLAGPELVEDIKNMANWCDLVVVGDAYSDATERPFLPRASDIFEAVLSQAPQRYTDADGELIHDTNPAVHRAWDLAMRSLGEPPLFDDPCPEASDIDRFSANLSVGTEEWDEALRSGDIAAVIASAETLGVIQTTAPETSGRWRLVPLPEGGAGSVHGMSLAVRSDSVHATLAYDLVAFLAEPTTQERVFEDLSRFPAASSLYTDDGVLGHRRPYFGDSPIGSIYAASVTDHPPAPDGPDVRLAQRELRGAVSRVESGNQSAQEAWDEAVWRIVRALD